MTFMLTDAAPTHRTRKADCPCGTQFVQRQHTLGPLSASVWGLDVVWLPIRCDECETRQDAEEAAAVREADKAARACMGIVDDAV